MSNTISPTNGEGEEVIVEEINSIKKADTYIGKDKTLGIVILTKEAFHMWIYKNKEDRDKVIFCY